MLPTSMHSARKGFILPAALILTTAVLVLATLILKQQGKAGSRLEARALHKRAQTTLSANVRPLVDHLESRLFHASRASAWQPVAGPGWQGIRTGLPPSEKAGMDLLASHGNPAKRIRFHSDITPQPLVADWLPLTPGDSTFRAWLAWSAEDIALSGPADPPPPFWPLPDWNLVPWNPGEPPAAFLDTLAGPSWRGGPWIETGMELPFRPEASPALVPVVERLDLVFGIFASGPLKSREKTVRLRFHAEAVIWNPYNRPMRIHDGSGKRTVIRAVWWNLPEVRIHNLTTGSRTGWIALDNARNAATGKRGLAAWIELPGLLEAGGFLKLLEPDGSYQPEGLARTLHPGFMTGPADAIRIEWREAEAGIHAAFLPVDTDDPLEAAMAGGGWFRLEGFPVDFPELVFDRADAPEHPFYLPGGSLAYRIGNAHVRLSLASTFDPLRPGLDPRQKRVHFMDTFMDPSGNSRTGGDRVTASGTPYPEPNGEEPARQPFSLFSWPDKEPENLPEAGDLPAWRDGFRIGSAGAAVLNTLLDGDLAFGKPPTDRSVFRMRTADDRELAFRTAFPVNLTSPPAWKAVLLGDNPGKSPVVYPVYPYPDSESADDFRSWTNAQVDRAAEALAAGAVLDPATRVSDFFTAGRMAAAFEVAPPHPGLHGLMPLRGWLREAPVPRAHGTAWVLHLAVHMETGLLSIAKSARIWLLERETGDSFRIIRFEWTDPGSHLPD